MFLKGIVEDNNDELKLGRVKVRVVGKHAPIPTKNDNYEFLPTKDLPYATPIYPAGASSISGVNQFSVPEINSVVVCGYFDEDEQEMFYIGTLALVGSNKLTGYGVSSNPNPKKSYPLSDLVSGTNNLRQDSSSNTLFSVPGPSYATVYPNNNVIQTKTGHVIELDDSSGAERLRIYHKSGTYTETNPDGSNVDSSVGDKYITTPNLNVHCENNCNVYVGTNNNVEIGNDNIVNIGNNSTITVGLNSSLTAGGNITLFASGSIGVSAVGTSSGSTGGLDIEVKGDCNVTTLSACNLTSVGDCSISANNIHLNP